MCVFIGWRLSPTGPRNASGEVRHHTLYDVKYRLNVYCSQYKFISMPKTRPSAPRRKSRFAGAVNKRLCHFSIDIFSVLFPVNGCSARIDTRFDNATCHPLGVKPKPGFWGQKILRNPLNFIKIIYYLNYRQIILKGE